MELNESTFKNMSLQQLMETTSKLKELFTILTGNPKFSELRSTVYDYMQEGIKELKKNNIRFE